MKVTVVIKRRSPNLVAYNSFFLDITVPSQDWWDTPDMLTCSSYLSVHGGLSTLTVLQSGKRDREGTYPLPLRP